MNEFETEYYVQLSNNMRESLSNLDFSSSFMPKYYIKKSSFPSEDNLYHERNRKAEAES